jgi:hypothetical protein
MDVPFIVINGSKGKSSTVNYLTYILLQLYSVNILNYEYDEELNEIVNLKVNNVRLNLFEIKKDINSNSSEFNIELIEYVCIRYNINFVVCKYNSLIIHFNVVVCGLTTIEYSIDTLNLDKDVENLTINSKGFLREMTPLVTCLHSKDFMIKLFKLSNLCLVPIFLTNFYHLKYINYNTGIDSRYSYINVAIALVICEILNNTYNLDVKAKRKTDEIIPVDIKKYKTVEYDIFKSLFCKYISPLPNLKNIYLGCDYNNIKKINDNLTFYFDSAGSFKSSNLALNWFNSKKENDINMCIFGVEPTQDLIKTFLPISNINLETLFLIDYNLKGESFDNLLSTFSGMINEEDDKDNSWIETTYNTVNYIYTDVDFQYARRKSSLPINDYAGLEEIKNVSEDEITNIAPPKTPNIIVDDTSSVLKWITSLSSNNKTSNFRVLVTGCKTLTNDIYISV